MLTRKTSKWHSLLFLKTTIFKLSSKTQRNAILLSTYTIKNYGKFPDRNLKKFCPRFLASTIPALSLALRRSVLEKLVLGSRFFFEPLALALASNVVSSTPLAVNSNILLKRFCPTTKTFSQSLAFFVLR